MHRSEAILRNVPGGAERSKTLEALSDQLEKVGTLGGVCDKRQELEKAKARAAHAPR